MLRSMSTIVDASSAFRSWATRKLLARAVALSFLVNSRTIRNLPRTKSRNSFRSIPNSSTEVPDWRCPLTEVSSMSMKNGCSFSKYSGSGLRFERYGPKTSGSSRLCRHSIDFQLVPSRTWLVFPR